MNLDFCFSDTFDGEMAQIGAIAMDCPQPTFVPFAAQMDGQLRFHPGGKGVAGDLPEVQPHYVKELFRCGANLLENLKNLGDVQIHGVSPFEFGLGTTQSNGDTPFLYL
ncbi:MAG: hypothetical protein WCD80_04855 [Desulfobaccales bacterium]